ncbi:MAG: hypothetical protein AB8G77_08700 [Rhodothermales bacterium]
MAFRIPVYIPNISTEKLIELLSISLDMESSIVDFELLEKGARFRAPELAIVVTAENASADVLSPDSMPENVEKRLIIVVQHLINAARILGATQFSIEHKGFDMRLRPTNLDVQHIEHLIIASGSFKIDQINIF